MNDFKLPTRVLQCLFFSMCLLGINSASIADELLVDVTTDLSGLGCPYGNAAGDGNTDDANAIRWAVDYVINQGGGDVYLPAGTYAVRNIHVFDEANLVGDGPGQTIIRPHPNDHTFALIYLRGGQMRDLTCYGTLPEDSGDNWTCWAGEATHLIQIRDDDGPNSVSTMISLLKNVHAYEAPNDCLYMKDCNNAHVVDCVFDRSGRHIAAHVGNSVADSNEGFFFLNCTFGSLRGYCVWDFEPTSGRAINGGIFLNCRFEGEASGIYGTKETWWGSSVVLQGTDNAPYNRRNVATLGCDFNDVYVRVNRVFPDTQFIYNTIESPPGYDIFVKHDATGDFKDAKVIANTFVGASSWGDVIQDANFSGDSFFACNKPLWANDSGYSWHEPNYSDLALLHSVSNLEDLSFNELMRLVNNCPRELIDYCPSISWNPNPADRTSDVNTSAVLSWSPGDKAVSHDVYIGTDFNDVNDASISLLAGDVDSDRKVDWADALILVEQWLTSPGSLQPSADLDGDGDVNLIDFTVLANYWMQRTEGNQDANSYIPAGLESGKIYYWRIDQVNVPNTWKGDVWSFYTATDTTVPTPSPMTWYTAPYEAGSYSIDMIADEAFDFSSVEYYFENQSIADHNSSWQDCRFWKDEGLEPETSYCYKVKARDKSSNENQTTWSSQECATTAAECGSAPMYREGAATNTSIMGSFGNALLPLLPSMAAIGIWGIYRRKRLNSSKLARCQVRITRKNKR